ncbi:MAG: hypothetical protein OWS74_08685, partial [Firmicutes bacterium]|nr:hypothetical protein [Bacillota bacterium]
MHIIERIIDAGQPRTVDELLIYLHGCNITMSRRAAALHLARYRKQAYLKKCRKNITNGDKLFPVCTPHKHFLYPNGRSYGGMYDHP